MYNVYAVYIFGLLSDKITLTASMAYHYFVIHLVIHVASSCFIFISDCFDDAIWSFQMCRSHLFRMDGSFQF